MRVVQQEKLDPGSCWKRHESLDPKSCSAVSNCIENGEPALSRCGGCPIADKEFCPDIDELSKSAIQFSAYIDHPAHENYANIIWEYLSPSLSPAELLPFLHRRQAVWEEKERISRQKLENDAAR